MLKSLDSHTTTPPSGTFKPSADPYMGPKLLSSRLYTLALFLWGELTGHRLFLS
jgi:hypothetical protein